jgi:hypothetical protein
MALDEHAATGACRVAVDPLGSDLFSLATLQRLVHADDYGASAGKGAHQQTKQYLSGFSAGPPVLTQYPMVFLELRLLVQSHHPQCPSDSAFARSQDSADNQDLNLAETHAGKTAA